jgi:hypothetical protein
VVVSVLDIQLAAEGAAGFACIDVARAKSGGVRMAVGWIDGRGVQ